MFFRNVWDPDDAQLSEGVYRPLVKEGSGVDIRFSCCVRTWTKRNCRKS